MKHRQPFGLGVQRRLRTILPCDRGMAALIAAILMPIVIGGLGLGAETGFWYLKKHRLQAAADLSAHAAAVRLRNGASGHDLETSVLTIASGSGYLVSRGSHSILVPPSKGRFKDLPGHVEVVLAETHPRMFSAIFNDAPVTVAARAVAGVNAGDEACAIALHPSASPGLAVLDGGSVKTRDCALASNSTSTVSVSVAAGGYVDAKCLHAVGGVRSDGSVSLGCGAPRERSHAVIDPYADLQEPNVHSLPCRQAILVGMGGNGILFPADTLGGRMAMRICGDLTVSGGIHMLPGIYVVDGAVEVFPGGSLTGTGVTIYMRQTGRFLSHPDSTLALSPPGSGFLAGIVVLGSRNGSRLISMTGQHAAALRGAVYAPTSEFRVTGKGFPPPSCLQIVVGRMAVEGPIALETGCISGSKAAYAGRQVAVVE